MSTDEYKVLRRASRENKTLHEEREIVEKAQVRFAKETGGSIPPTDASL